MFHFILFAFVQEYWVSNITFIGILVVNAFLASEFWSRDRTCLLSVYWAFRLLDVTYIYNM